MKKIIKLIAVLFVGFLTFSTGLTLRENFMVRRKVTNFIKNAELQNEISDDKIKYYKVSRETLNFVETFNRVPFFNDNFDQPGAEGDIFVTRDSPFPYMPGIHQFVSFYFGGHAGYIDDNNKVYEIIGFPSSEIPFLELFFKSSSETVVTAVSNYWLNPHYRTANDSSFPFYGSYYRDEWFGLRVKGATEENVSDVTNLMRQMKDDQLRYNFQFIFNTKNRYYCTDMMSRPYETIINNNSFNDINLNGDGVAVTVDDLILSSDVYISYYMYTDKNNVKHVYYID